MNNLGKTEIYFAGGCFWGLEKYLSLINGIVDTEVGYANGNTVKPTYDDVCKNGSGHSESVKVIYDKNIISLEQLLDIFYCAIDPTAINRQGNDFGSQYRSGIYYIDNNDKDIIEHSISELSKKYNKPIQIEIEELKNYYPAENYHQKYLDKNPYGYCHIGKEKFDFAKNYKTTKKNEYSQKTKEQLFQTLSPLQYDVTQKSATEPPFKNEYFSNFDEGIYVDITTGEPLFMSTEKFESGCGWPSFAKPISSATIIEIEDKSFGMRRTEVRSKIGDAHLGHIFNDGPKSMGGLRYCINSASLKFIPKENMEQEGYAKYLSLFDK